jgi:LysR family glycine cleavage system transcriptional activator
LPLHVLPAFEAAARHASFRAAALELHLTPSAISHQIRALERALGVPLFVRLPRGLKLTEAGQKYALTVSEVLTRLEREADEAGRTAAPARLRVSMPDFVARYVVLPALSRFRSRHPRIELEISTSMALANLEAGEADAAIRLGHGTWGQLRSYRMTTLVATIVATPRLAAQARTLSERGELPVVCLDTLEDHTRKVLGEIGLAAPPERMLRFDNPLSLLQAAEEGLGVTVLPLPPGARRTPNERLVPLSSQTYPFPFATYFVCRRRDADRPDIAALRAWLSELMPQDGEQSGPASGRERPARARSLKTARSSARG